MGNLTFTHKLCISVCWGLLLMYAAAEREYFVSSHNASWEEARNHCQVCFKEMVTLTPQNVHVIAKMIDADHWVGLRKYINYNGTYNDTNDYDGDSYINPGNATNASSKSFGTPWTLWANGDPLVFQNWYPGYPVFKSPLPKIDCCSCSCTCPAPIRTTTSPPTGSTVTDRDPTEPNITANSYDNMTDLTNWEFENTTDFSSGTNVSRAWESTAVYEVHTTDSPWMTTPQLPIVSTCDRSPMLPPVIPENNKNYIENSCVAMLSFGPWVERVCTEQLPFICFEDRFMGTINVSNITSSSASLQWDKGPGDISRYRFEAASLEDSWNFTIEFLNLSYVLDKLTPGTGYKIQVFAVKCERDLNPMKNSFYTIPGEVQNLTVTNFTETSVGLSWRKPAGNYGFFRITANSRQPTIIKDTKTDDFVFDSLTQGTEYKFIFTTGVDDGTKWSQNVSISNCTRPGKVSNLTALNNSDTHLMLKWDLPKGNYLKFEVKAFDKTNDLNATVAFPTDLRAEPYVVNVSHLPNGNEIQLFVKVLGVCGLEGETENITTHTAPGPISNLSLVANHDTLDASWSFDPKHGSGVYFSAKLFLEEKHVLTKNSPNKTVKFEHLKTATKYTVKVYAVIDQLESPEMTASIFTLPSPPTNLKVRENTSDSLTFEWTAPANSSANEYNCTLHSDFWKEFQHKTVQNISCRFTGLKSGSTYKFEVKTLSDDKASESASCTGTTVKDEVEIRLSMICASEQSLYCEKQSTKDSVFDELQKHFKVILDGYVVYEVKKD